MKETPRSPFVNAMIRVQQMVTREESVRFSALSSVEKRAAETLVKQRKLKQQFIGHGDWIFYR